MIRNLAPCVSISGGQFTASITAKIKTNIPYALKYAICTSNVEQRTTYIPHVLVLELSVSETCPGAQLPRASLNVRLPLASTKCSACQRAQELTSHEKVLLCQLIHPLRRSGPHSQCMQVVVSWLTGHVSDAMCRTPKAGVRQLLQHTAAMRFEMIGRLECKISGIQNHLPLMQVVWEDKKRLSRL